MSAEAILPAPIKPIVVLVISAMLVLLVVSVCISPVWKLLKLAYCSAYCSLRQGLWVFVGGQKSVFRYGSWWHLLRWPLHNQRSCPWTAPGSRVGHRPAGYHGA